MFRLSDKLIKRTAAVLCTAVITVSAFGIRTVQSSKSDEDGTFTPNPQKISAFVSADTAVSDISADSEMQDETSKTNETDSVSDNREDPEGNSDSSEFSRTAEDSAESTSSAVGESYASYTSYENQDSTDHSTDSSSRSNSSAASQDNTSSAASSDSKDSSNSSDGSRASREADDASRTDKPGDNPTDGGETDIVYFTTSITDGEETENSEYAFTITHLKKELAVKNVSVYVNGTLVQFSGTVSLSAENDGRNTIKIVAAYTDSNGEVISASRSYTVYLKSNDNSQTNEECKLVTDLYSHTRSQAELEFTAYISGNPILQRITVYHKTKKLTAQDSVYSCTLDSGINHITIKASYTDSDGEHTEQLEFDIKLIEETTAETAPYLEYNNVPSEVKGNLYTLDLAPRTYTGEKLYYNNLDVRLNGYTLSYSWDGEYVSYLLNLAAGENTLEIRVTDNEGRYTDYSFAITCLSAQDGEVIGYASLEVDANVLGLGDVLTPITFEIKQGESALDAITNAFEQNGFSVSTSGGYLSRISKEGIALSAAIPDELLSRIESDSSVYLSEQKDADSLGEKDYTNASGWLVCVNGHYTSYGIGDLHLKDGDSVRLRFTLAYGKDIGGYVGSDSNYDVQY